MVPNKLIMAEILQRNFTDTEKVLWRYLRFCDSGTIKFLANIEGVLDRKLFESPSPHAPPLKGGEIRKEPPIEGVEIADDS